MKSLSPRKDGQMTSEQAQIQIADMGQQLQELRNQMHLMEVENERLTVTMREMVESYTT